MGYLWKGIMVLFVLEMLSFAFFITKIGFIVVFLLWLLSVVTGGYMVRQGGLTTLMAILSKPQESQKFGFDGIFIFIAGLLFIFPGFISDIIAVMVLMPFAQSLFKPLTVKFTDLARDQNKPYPFGQDGGVIEGNFEVVDDDNKINLPSKDTKNEPF